MDPTKGIQDDPVFKLGKAPVKRDKRNLKFAAILKAAVVIPPAYDVDVKHPGVPTPMFCNDTYGDCVIAGRAHQTLRFELVEQKKIIHITDNEVLKEYFKETGGQDTGLVVLDSLKLWRKEGWIAARRRYKIMAFAQIDEHNHDEVKNAVFMDLGVALGLSLPLTAKTQISQHQPWDAVKGPGSAPNSWGGHYVYVNAYDETGLECVTWGQKQKMTWAFVDKYCDEAYGIIDAINTQKKKRGLKAAAVEEFLANH